MISRIRRVLGTFIEALPEAVSLAVRPSRYRYRRVDRPRPAPVLNAKTRLLIGHANYAAQGYWFARAAERIDDVAAVNVHLLGPNEKYGFPADIPVSAQIFQHSAHWRREHFRRVTTNYTHVIIESGLPIFGKLFGHDVLAEINALRAHGLTVALLAHGSELRQPSRHASTDEWSPYAPGRWPETARLEARTKAFKALLGQADVPLFVTTQELLEDWPSATWIPLSINLARWSAALPFMDRPQPVVVHAPTNPYLKNTALIEPTMQWLHDEGVVEYRRLPSVTSQQMPALIGDADVVLDQFGAGCYSVASVEGMAAGRLVIAHVHEQVRQIVRESTGWEIPIVSATPGTLDNVLRDVVARPEHYRAIAARGPDFTAAVHDGRLSAAALKPFLTGS